MSVEHLGLELESILSDRIDILYKDGFALALAMASLVHREEVVAHLAPLLSYMRESANVFAEAVDVEHHPFELCVHFVVVILAIFQIVEGWIPVTFQSIFGHLVIIIFYDYFNWIFFAIWKLEFVEWYHIRVWVYLLSL